MCTRRWSRKMPHWYLKIDASKRACSFKKRWTRETWLKFSLTRRLQNFTRIIRNARRSLVSWSRRMLLGSPNNRNGHIKANGVKWYREHPVQCHWHMPLLRAGPSPGSVTNNSNELADATLRPPYGIPRRSTAVSFDLAGPNNETRRKIARREEKKREK